jgi:hypothetical protein
VIETALWAVEDDLAVDARIRSGISVESVDVQATVEEVVTPGYGKADLLVSVNHVVALAPTELIVPPGDHVFSIPNQIVISSEAPDVVMAAGDDGAVCLSKDAVKIGPAVDAVVPPGGDNADDCTAAIPLDDVATAASVNLVVAAQSDVADLCLAKDVILTAAAVDLVVAAGANIVIFGLASDEILIAAAVDLVVAAGANIAVSGLA